MTAKSNPGNPAKKASPGGHFASTDEEAALSEFEWALVRWYESYVRFTRESLAAVGGGQLTAQEVMILHVIRMHDRPKTASMVANLLNRTDIQNVNYSTRKLIAQKLVSKVKQGAAKSAALTATALGRRLCDDIATYRRTALLDSLRAVGDLPERLHSVANATSLLTALYDQAEREAVRPVFLLSKLPGS